MFNPGEQTQPIFISTKNSNFFPSQYTENNIWTLSGVKFEITVKPSAVASRRLFYSIAQLIAPEGTIHPMVYIGRILNRRSMSLADFRGLPLAVKSKNYRLFSPSAFLDAIFLKYCCINCSSVSVEKFHPIIDAGQFRRYSARCSEKPRS